MLQNIVTTDLSGFVKGDTLGKRDIAVQDALIEKSKQEPGSIREKLYCLQSAIGDLPEVEMPLQHLFAPGVYIRTIFIPKNCVLVGKIHKHAHANILSQGSVMVMTEGGGIEYLSGPKQMVSLPGTKRAVHALTDVVWTTIHPTNSTDLAEIEDQVIAKTFEDYDKFQLNQTKILEVTL